MSVPDPSPNAESARLNGWKDIANYLGKGVRTVQRWEKQYGLPVRRIGEDGGDIVFAYVREIDEWLRRWEKARAERQGTEEADSAADFGEAVATALPAEPAPAPIAPPLADAPAAAVNGRAPELFPSPSPSSTPHPAATRRVSVSTMVLAAVALGAIALVVAWAWQATPPNPASWRVEAQHLVTFDSAGRELWRYRFWRQVSPASFPTVPENGAWSTPVTIVDLEGDGTNEVLVSGPAGGSLLESSLTCLESDGTIRWSRHLGERHRFGGEEFAPPWRVYHYAVIPEADGTWHVWAVFVHTPYFPSVLEQINPRGDVLTRYWSNGYITALAETEWGGQRVLLAGSVNNEHKGSALAVLSRERPSGMAPALNAAYRCSTCPAGDPLAFVVFPPSPVGKVRGEGTIVPLTYRSGEGVVTVIEEVIHGLEFPSGGLLYTLNEDLDLVKLEVTAQYKGLHDALFKVGRIDRPYSPAEELLIGRVLVWDEGRFVEKQLEKR